MTTEEHGRQSEEHGHQSIENGRHGHAGDGHGAYDPSMLQRADAFYGGVYQEICDWLSISPGAHALEAGSGAGGFMTNLLRRWVESEERRGFIGDEDAESINKLIDPDDSQYAFNRSDLHYMEGVTIYLGTA